jgi:uncharacterized membrane protein YeiH
MSMHAIKKLARDIIGVVLLGTAIAGGATADLTTAIDLLKNHLAGTTVLTAAQIAAQAAIIDKNIAFIGADDKIILDALGLVQEYETKTGPLFINAATKGGFSRTEA